MFAALFCAVAVANPVSVAGVQLSDAYQFGVSREAVRDLWRLTTNHKSVMRNEVRSHNHADTAWYWEQECDWRSRCWFLLDDALFMDNLTELQKVRSLAELRSLLGDADYYAGRMPEPTPRYRPWSD